MSLMNLGGVLSSAGAAAGDSDEFAGASNDQAGSTRLVRWIAAAKQMYSRWHQRQVLLRLDDHLLADIGMSRLQAEWEAGKPFWQE